MDLGVDAGRPAGARVYVHNYLGRGASAHFARYRAGAVDDASPYGFHGARALGFDVTLSEDSPSRVSRFVSRVSRRILGFDVPHALFNRRAIRAADVVWAMTERETFAVAFLQRLRLVPVCPIITSTVWITNDWGRIAAYKRWIFGRLGRSFTFVTVQSRSALGPARQIFPASTVELMYFGISTEVFVPTPPAPPYSPDVIRIFAAGTDRTRDWPTFLAAFGNDPRFALEIYCWWLPSKVAAAYDNVVVHRAMPIEAFVAAIRSADIVAIPMKENTFSGITFALNAAALGKTMLASRTGGVTTYFDEGEVLYCAVGDAADMRSAVAGSTPQSRHEVAARAHRRFLDRDYTTAAMMQRYAEMTRSLRLPARRPEVERDLVA